MDPLVFESGGVMAQHKAHMLLLFLIWWGPDLWESLPPPRTPVPRAGPLESAAKLPSGDLVPTGPWQ